MPTTSDFPARGKVLRIQDGCVIFAPANSTYELKLAASGYTGPLNEIIEGQIHAVARKVWTVASGGNFVTPIQGPTRIIQGRIKYLDDQTMVVQAGVPVIIQLPVSPDAVDLNNGDLSVGSLVNATLLPGAKFELVSAPAASSVGAA